MTHQTNKTPNLSEEADLAQNAIIGHHITKERDRIQPNRTLVKLGIQLFITQPL